MSEKLSLVPVKNNIRIKKQDDNYVIFNLATSGFHMVTSDCFDILEKVDGTTSIGELAEFFSKDRNLDLTKLQNDFMDFFDDLQTRKIVELKERI